MSGEANQRVGARDDDAALIERVRAGDARAFEELVRRHERRVYRTTLAVTGNREDAEETMQDTFLKAYQHLDEFRGSARFTTWLTRIAVNEGLQKLRKRRPTESLDEPRPDQPPEAKQLEDWRANPEQLYAAQEIREMVEEAIRALPPPYRVAFVLRDVEKLSTEEATETLGLSIPAMKSRILRARLMVRETLAARLGQPAGWKGKFLRARMRIREALARSVGQKGAMP